MTDYEGLRRAVRRGISSLCPACGRGPIYTRYLKTAPNCDACGAPNGDIRTDDIAPYFTILIVGHIIVSLLLITEQLFAPPVWVHWITWPPMTLLAALLVLPRVKGAIMGWMWWLDLKGDEQH